LSRIKRRFDSHYFLHDRLNAISSLGQYAVLEPRCDSVLKFAFE
jgi:hypothetical protein